MVYKVSADVFSIKGTLLGYIFNNPIIGLLVVDQDNNFYLISLCILITCLLDNVWILQGEVTC